MTDITELAQTMPLAALLGIELTHAEPASVGAKLAWRPELCTAGGAMHGGALMTLADSSAAMCAYLNLPSGATGTTTIESKTNFLGALRDGDAVAVSRPIHVGSTTIVVETDIFEGNRLVTKTLQTQAVLRAR